LEEVLVDFHITGTHVWYYVICQRQVWLLSRQIVPDQEHESLILGRINDQNSYARKKKYLYFEGGVVDLFREKNGRLLISEVKKSSRFEDSARMQLLFYLYKLKQLGIDAAGELRIPKEKKVIPIELNPELEQVVQTICQGIEKIVSLNGPPKPKKCRYCRGCAYLEFCWS
jgi:CRISPR-associated exonuclease Cas4